jgi:GNAT superfamily N-acetyltransferase
MSKLNIQVAETDDQIAACFPVLHELRPHLKDAAELVTRVRLQQKEGYVLAYSVGSDGKPAGCMGFRRQNRLVHGAVIYVDDLVTLGNQRSAGHGKALLAWLEELARAEGYGAIDLDSGTQRVDAHRFYLRERFIISSFHFLKKVMP